VSGTLDPFSVSKTKGRSASRDLASTRELNSPAGPRVPNLGADYAPEARNPEAKPFLSRAIRAVGE
jgi:hypothetical protein